MKSETDTSSAGKTGQARYPMGNVCAHAKIGEMQDGMLHGIKIGLRLDLEFCFNDLSSELCFMILLAVWCLADGVRLWIRK